MVSSNIISVSNLSKSFPERRVLESVSFGIDEGDHLGVIGFNGSGKTTLLQLIAGAVAPDTGTIVRRNGLRVAHLEQDPGFSDDATVEDIAADGRDTIAYLDKLGITDISERVGNLSGGQRRRVALARALAVESDLLILDEPTNHLDIEAIDWLEEELARRSQTVVLVTHDRYLLDRVATRILEISAGEIHTHHGRYQDYLEAREARREHAARSEQKRMNLARVELDWLRRSPKARTSKSKARIDRATALQQPKTVEQRAELNLELASRRLGDKVVELSDVSVRFEDRSILNDITWRLAAGDRVGIVGPNGSGKTTLLRLLGGRLVPSQGAVAVGETVAAGWYGQDPEPIAPSRRIHEVMGEWSTQTRLESGIMISGGQLLERFGFPSTQHSTEVGDLSGGERRRLELLRVLVQAPNLLLLDEPTNDLDLETLGVLELFLDTWGGSVVAASHDRYFLQRVCNDIMSIDPDGSLRHHPGGYQAYLETRERVSETDTGSDETPSPQEPPSDRYRERLSYVEQREYQRIEKEIEAMSARLSDIDALLADTGADWERATGLSEERASIVDRLDAAESRWLELSDRV